MSNKREATLAAKLATLEARNAALEEEKRHYQWLAESTTDLISRHAPDGRFIDATPASWRLLGYWPEELRGKSLEEVFGNDKVAEQLTHTRNRLQEDGYATLTLEIQHRNGNRRWFEIASRAIRGEIWSMDFMTCGRFRTSKSIRSFGHRND